MKTAYINQFGIRPWESIHPTGNVRFTTTTLINHNFNSVWESWCEIMGQLVGWPIKRAWCAALAPHSTQELKNIYTKKLTSIH